MKNIHNEKGITLATLAIYIISMLIALAILATVTAYFHGAFKDTTKNTADIAEWDKFNLYFLDEVKASGSGISAPIKEGSTNAAFINGNTYEYNASDKAVYLVNSKENIKVAQNVEKCTFHSSQTDGKTIVTVAMTIGGNERSEDYVLGEGAVSNYEEENNYIAVDTTAPTITISAPSSTIVRNGASVTYTVTYADNNFDKSTLKAADITLNKTGTADAAVAVTGAGTTYTVTISNVTGAGTLGISIAAGTASDKAGNMAPVAGPSQTFAIDNTAPPAPILAQAPTAWTNGSVTVTATHPADSTVKEYSTDGTAWNAYTTPVVVDANGTVYARYKDSLGNLSATGSIVITNIDKIAPTVAFGTNGGVTKTGSTTVTVSDTGGSGVNPGSLQYVWSTSTTDPGTGYLLFTNGAVLTGPTMQNGAYYLWIKASDNAGNTVAGGAVRSNAFTTDNIAPTITISAPSSALVKGGASVTYTVTYADTNFNSSTLAVANITLNKTGTANGTVAVSGTGLTRTVTISNVTGDGTLGISIAAGTATDTAGNTAPAAGPSATFTVDSTAPTCTITANPSANPTNASSITYTFTFSEAVTGFAVGDVTITNGTAGTFTAVSGTVYTLVVTNTGSVSQTAAIVANVATDAAGNGNTAATLTVTIDRTVPTCTITANPSANPTNASSITYTFTFSEAVTGFVAGDVTITNGTAGTFTAVSGTVYTLVVTNTGSVSQTAAIAENVATDAAGNGNTAATLTVTIDRTAPTITIAPANAAICKTVNITITTADAGGAGLAAANSYQYQFGTSNTTAPTGTWTNYTSGTAFAAGTGLTGTYYLWVKTIADSAGNKSAETVAGYTVAGTYIFDNTAPTITIAPANAALCKTVDITITAADGGSGLSLSNSYQYQFGTSNTTAPTGTWTNYTSGTAFAAGAGLNGTYYLWVKTIADNAGNKSSETVAGYTVAGTYIFDNTAPTITISAPSAAMVKGGASVTYTVTYADTNFNTSTLAAANITLNKTGTANGTVAVSGTGLTRTVTINGITGDGTLGISIAAGTATDNAGNAAPAAGPSATFTVDSTAPTITISAPSAAMVKSGASVTYTVTYADTNFSASTLAVANITLNKTGTANGTVAVTGSGTTYTVTISGVTGDGTLGISIVAGTGADTAGNAAPAAGPSATFTVDSTLPTITISAPSSTAVKAGATVTYTVTYADTNFNTATLAAANITVNKTGTATGTAAVTGSGLAFTVTISGITGEGTLGISIAAGTATDNAGNAAPAAGPSATFIVDATAPTITISAPSATLVKGGASVTYTVTYTDTNFDTSTLAAANITLNKTGTANGTIAVSGTGNTRTVTISAVSGDGTLGISIAAGTGADKSGNTAPAAGPSSTFTVDSTLPTITITPPNAAVCKTVNITITAADGGSGLSTANSYQYQFGASNTTAPTGTWTNYTSGTAYAAGTGLNGTYYLWVKTISDNAGNKSAETVAGYTVAGTYIFDNTAPTITISAPSATVAKAGATVTYTVTYADTNFNTATLAAANITVNKTGTANGTAAVTGSGTTYTVTISGITGDGTLGISIAAGTATDTAGNAAPAAGPSTTFIVDSTVPTITISAPSATFVKSGSSVTYTVTYTDTNFNSSTLAVANITLNKTGTANGTMAVSGTGNTRTVTISAVTGDGTLGISIAAGTATDTAGNATPAAGPSATFTVDSTLPTITISAPSTTSVKAGGTITYAVTYADTNFNSATLVAANITLNKTGTATGTAAVTGSGTTYTVTISGITGDGTIGISIAAGTATDKAGNAAPAAGPSATFTVDSTAPTITITPPNAALCKTVNITITAADGGSGLSSANSYQYQFGTSNTIVPTGTWTNYTSGTAFTGGTGLNGTYYLWVKTIADNAGNNSAETVAGYTVVGTYIFDNTLPTITISAPSSTAVKAGATVTYTVTYADTNFNTATLATANVTVNKTGTATGTAAVTGSGLAFTVTISGITGEGTLGISIAAGTATDLAGNSAPAAGPSATFIVDNTAPTITISAPSSAMVKGGASVTYTVTYADTNFNTSTLAVANITLNKTGTANGTVAVTGSGLAYTVTISAVTGDGTLGISIAAGTATDKSGNTAPAAGPSTTFTVDSTLPTITISAPSATAVKAGATVTYTVTYADTNFNTATLATANVTVNKTGTATGTAAVTGSGTTFTVTISGITGEGTLGISIAAGTATDKAGNAAPAAGPSATFIVDNTAPTITISAPSSAMVKGGTSVTYTVTYADTNFDTSTLALANITLNKTGTANGTVAVTGSGLTYTITISAVSGDGTLGISIAAGTATDKSGNTAPAAGPSATFTVDSTLPTITISAPSSTAVKAGATVTYTVTYADTNFNSATLATANVTVNKTGTANGTAAVTGSGLAYTVTITGITGDGTLGISIAAGTATDKAGNAAPAAGPSATFIVDNTAPTITISAPSVTAAKGGGSVTFAVTYADTNFNTSTLAAANITLNKTGTANGTAAVTGSGLAYTVTISGLTGDGTLGISIAAGTATDKSGNTAPAAGPSTTFIVDSTLPTITISAPSATLVKGGTNVTYTVTYADTNFNTATLAAANITVNKGGTATGTAAVTGSGTTYTVTISATSGDGTIGISIAAGTGADTAGNAAPAAGPSATFTVDSTPPTITNALAGTMLYADPIFANGSNGTSVYNNAGGGTVTVTRMAMTGMPTGSSGYGLEITTTGAASPGWGGFYFGHASAANKVFITKITAKIPVGYTINWGSNATGTGGTSGWLTSQAGTGAWQDYIFMLTCGSTGTFSTTDYYYLSGGTTPTATAPLVWDVAYATVIDTTLWGTRNEIMMSATDTNGVNGYGINQSSSTQPTFTAVTAATQVAAMVNNYTANGTYYAWAKDVVGNVANKAVTVSYIDLAAPTVTVSAPSATVVKNAGSVTYTVTYADANFNTSTLTAANITLNKTGTANGTVAVTGSGTTYTVTISGITGDGTLGITVAAGTATDLAGNKSPASAASAAFTVDSTLPTITISAPSATMVKGGTSVTYTVTYADTNFSSSTLAAANITLNKTGTANGTLAVSGTGNTRTVTISAVTGDGTLGISIAAGTGTDTAGNSTPAAGPSATFTVDSTLPTITISVPSVTAVKTGGTVTYTVTYADTNFNSSTLVAANITVNKTGTATGTAAVTGSGTTFTVTISGISGAGTLGISIAAGTATDKAGNSAPAAGPSATFAIDDTAPTITISAPSATMVKGGTSVTYTVTYADTNFNSSTLAVANITLNKTGTANGTLAVSGTGLTRTVTISGVTGDGTLGISIAAGTATDLAGNTAPAAGPSATFTVDSTLPTITISAPSATIVKGAGSVTYTVTYADTNFNSSTLATANITLNKTGTANGTVAVTGSGTTYTVTISAVTGDGTLGISIAAGTATDLAGNSTTAAGPSTTFIVDSTAPTITISAPSATAVKAGATVTYTVTYADTNFNTATLATANVTLNKTGTATGTAAVTGSGTTYTVTITGITGDGTLGISIAAGTATDKAGNSAPAAGPSTTFIVDNTAPTITISAPSATMVKGGTSVTYTVTYADTNFNTSTLAVANITLNKTGTANGTAAVTGSGLAYTVTITGITGDGTLGISIAAGTATDKAGNAAPAAGPSTTFTVDSSVTITNALAGTMLYADPTFASGVNGAGLYNNAANGAVTLARKALTGMPAGSSGYGLEITTTAAATPGWGGFLFAPQTAANKVLITRIIAKIPTGYTLTWAGNSAGTGSVNEWLTPTAGTGTYTEYIHKLTCGASGTFSTAGHYYLSGGTTPTTAAPLVWDVAYATVIDTTLWGQRNEIVMSATDSSGINGYGINQSSSTQPTWTSITSAAMFATMFNNYTANGTYYVWARDTLGNTGNKAVTVSYVDTAAPTGSYTLSNSGIVTSGTVTITVTGTDSGGSGMKQITKPDSTVATGASTTYTVSGNGDYSFILADNAGNTTTYTVTVSNIFTTSFNYVMAIPATNLSYTINLTTKDLNTGTTFAYNFLVDWGDSKTSTVTSQADTNKTHAYTAAGNYTVKIYGIAQGGIDFYNETRLTQVLTPYPSAMNVTTTMAEFFYYCTALTSIPTGLFNYTPNVTYFAYTFAYCTALTGSIPAGLFNYTPNVTNFDYTFYNCTALTGSIPAGLFNYTPNVTDFEYTFGYCTGLTGAIPAGLFNKTTAVTRFWATFWNCTGLTGAIPTGLFDYTPNVTTFCTTFFNCWGLTGAIPTGLFNKTTAVTDFSATFKNCSGLTSIPTGLFDYTPNVTNFQGTFNGCSKLTSIPATLFDYTPNVTSFSDTFYYCNALTSIPIGLFNKTLNVTNFYNTFAYCTALTGNAPTLWTRTNVTTSTQCFYSCTGLTNYASIPAGWK